MKNSNELEKCPLCPKMLKQFATGKAKHMSSAHPKEWRRMKKEGLSQQFLNPAASTSVEIFREPPKAQGSTISYLEAAHAAVKARRAVLGTKIAEIEALRLEDASLENEQKILEEAMRTVALAPAQEEHLQTLRVPPNGAPARHARPNGPA